MARLAFEARYSGTPELFSNSGSRLRDQDLKDFDLLGRKAKLISQPLRPDVRDGSSTVLRSLL